MALTRVLFVCTGNTCRSVFAEHLGRRFAADVLSCESAGTTPQGAADAENALHTLRETFGIDALAHQPRNVRDVDLAKFDLIIAFRDPASGGGRATASDDPAAILRSIGAPESKLEVWKVGDPWGGDLADYERAALDIRKNLAALKRRMSHEPNIGIWTPPSRGKS